MPELAAYRESLNHSHDWQPLGDGEGAARWCPGCGHVLPFNPEREGA